jgi:ribosomal protein S27AE
MRFAKGSNGNTVSRKFCPKCGSSIGVARHICQGVEAAWHCCSHSIAGADEVID